MMGAFTDMENFREKKREMREQSRDQATGVGGAGSLTSRNASEGYNTAQQRRNPTAGRTSYMSGAENAAAVPSVRRSPRTLGSNGFVASRRGNGSSTFNHQSSGRANVGLRDVTNTASNRAMSSKKGNATQVGRYGYPDKDVPYVGRAGNTNPPTPAAQVSNASSRYCSQSRASNAVIVPPAVANSSIPTVELAPLLPAQVTGASFVPAVIAQAVPTPAPSARSADIEVIKADSLYALLGVVKYDASSEEITVAYTAMLPRLELDILPVGNKPCQVNATQNLLKLKQAYEILTDSTKREEYDTMLRHVDGLSAPSTVVEYVQDICGHLFREEALFLPRPNYMDAQQSEINGRMRAILVDWLVEVHMKYRLRAETLYLTINLIDRYLSVCSVTRRRLQLVGVSAMLIAAKFEEIQPPEIAEFAYITDNAYRNVDIVQMECHMLSSLAFKVSVPTAAHFLERLQMAPAGTFDELQLQVVRYLCELAIVETRMIQYIPSHLVASAVLLSAELLQRQPAWTPTIAEFTRYGQHDIRACADDLGALLEAAPRAELQAVRRRFSLDRHLAVAKMEFQGPVVW